MPTDDEIRRVLAEKLMGMKPIEGFYYYGDDTWNPLRNIEQAMMCVEKFTNYTFNMCAIESPRYKAKVFNRVWHTGESEISASVALSRACYAAIKEG